MTNRKRILLFTPFILLLGACSSAGKKIPEDKKEDGEPSLMAPQVRRMWVPDKIEADQYIKGHFIYFIEKGAQWKAQ